MRIKILVETYNMRYKKLNKSKHSKEELYNRKKQERTE